MFLCLNLNRRPDRRLLAWEQFRKQGLKVAKIVAPDAQGSEARGWRNPGARACALAHRLAWRPARKNGLDTVLVFEDDVILAEGFKKRLEELEAELPSHWQVVYFGCVLQQMPEVLRPGLLKIRGATWDMHGYLIRTAFAAKVSRLLQVPSHRRRQSGMVPAACDVIMASLHGQHPAYTVWPPMAWQRQGLSNNENCVRGNYRPDGRQIPFAHIAVELDRIHGIIPQRHTAVVPSINFEETVP